MVRESQCSLPVDRTATFRAGLFFAAFTALNLVIGVRFVCVFGLADVLTPLQAVGLSLGLLNFVGASIGLWFAGCCFDRALRGR